MALNLRKSAEQGLSFGSGPVVARLQLLRQGLVLVGIERQGFEGGEIRGGKIFVE
jgi:hypothetical protein